MRKRQLHNENCNKSQDPTLHPHRESLFLIRLYSRFVCILVKEGRNLCLYPVSPKINRLSRVPLRPLSFSSPERRGAMGRSACTLEPNLPEKKDQKNRHRRRRRRHRTTFPFAPIFTPQAPTHLSHRARAVKANRWLRLAKCMQHLHALHLLYDGTETPTELNLNLHRNQRARTIYN
ncbi:LAMI_0B03620g1_1 [Lachancea mirantina]|uniref:LAMI_0B03620g1_1 n=1 Tax=Lachancea mirantina TaxID=1230905 RepID=A0A1G4IUX2_9SACH|nr:LAMI_0B03620g1_1 [Lachancea mirantina]